VNLDVQCLKKQFLQQNYGGDVAMGLSNDLISQFAKLVNKPEPNKSETTAYGTAQVKDNTVYVQIDGSEIFTPVQTSVDVKDGERVIVSVKDHTVTITGNTSSPAARTDTVKEQDKKIDEFDIIVAHKITTDEVSAIKGYFEQITAITGQFESLQAITAEIETLKAKYAEIKYLTAEEVTAINGQFESLKAIFGEFTDLSTEDLTAINAYIDNLVAYNGKFTYIETELLKAFNADIGQLNVNKLDVNWANMDSANIDIARIGELLAKSGIIGDLTTENGTVTGTLVGVTIKGDLIEGNTIVADKLVVLGDDGLYYKLNVEAGTFTEDEVVPTNQLHGSVIVAKSITAEKVNVSDLVAFGATIGGFNISDYAIYSYAKDSEGNTVRGIYMDTDGQFNFGDARNYVKFEKGDDGNYKLLIAADSILYNLNGEPHSIADLGALGEYVKIGVFENEPCIELGESDSDFKLIITNTRIMFREGTSTPAYVNNKALNIDKAIIENELQMGDEEDTSQSGVFIWKVRRNGNMGLQWKKKTGVTR
jgi:hypothetical protein